MLYSALLSCLEYRFYSLIFPVLLSVANKNSFIRSFIHSFIHTEITKLNWRSRHAWLTVICHVLFETKNDVRPAYIISVTRPEGNGRFVFIAYSKRDNDIAIPFVHFSVMPNTHRRRRCESTVELSRVGVGGVYWIRNWLTTTADDCRRKFGNWTCWEFILSSWVELSCVGCHDPVYNSAADGVGLEYITRHTWHDATRLRCRQIVQTRRDSTRLLPTCCEFNTHRRHNSTRQLSCVGVGGVYWA